MEDIRKANNLTKRSLIAEAVGGRRGLQVLDVGCGCGGDLHKWRAVGARVDMCDPSSDSLDEAQRRANDMKYKVRFIHGDVRDCPKKLYDLVCFNFSIQYIFADHLTFIQSIKAIRQRLKPGGVLVGCVPDAQSILDHLPFRDSMGNWMEAVNQVGFGGFGETVNVFLTDTPYYNHGPHPESLCYRDMLTAHLESKGVLLEKWDGFEGEPLQRLYSKFLYRLY